jgi:hypothetical protein
MLLGSKIPARRIGLAQCTRILLMGRHVEFPGRCWYAPSDG